MSGAPVNIMPLNSQSAILEMPRTACPFTAASGQVIRKRNLPGFSVINTVYAAGTFLPMHCHEDAYLSFVLDGQYTEYYPDGESICAEGSLRFLPPGALHEDEYTAAARCLLVRIEPHLLERLGGHASVLSAPGEINGIAPTWLANRLHREFLAEDDIAELAMEGIVLEILAESARTIGKDDGSRAPRWLKRVREVLDDTYLTSPSLTELSSVAGVHQVHLSREFRKHYGCTIGEFIRKRRIDYACDLLAHSNTTLSEIAQVCGFSDQSHFSAMFKTHTGLTPAKFREASVS
jgi:AraC family transcriptional regulator